ncbi:uncharacterized protein [Centruroides vittatus]|uniref:uncharacterized protein n=1 Tax=Centruroides vittatus TaxID=120091 RepID=UPI00350F5929
MAHRRHGNRLIDDFLLPALNDRTYGNELKWIDESQRLFAIYWPRISPRSHPNDRGFKIFKDWDRMKGRPAPSDTPELVKSRQRFKAALRKLRIDRVPEHRLTSTYRVFRLND